MFPMSEEKEIKKDKKKKVFALQKALLCFYACMGLSGISLTHCIRLGGPGLWNVSPDMGGGVWEQRGLDKPKNH